ncbi:IS30 family transposase [Candidatus Berkelbacteria bacterium]|nr:IS30 family transposase [Candidatus Berkelbacteria bacterium]
MEQERLTFRDRQWIEFGAALGWSCRQIGRHVRRNHSVVVRELNRNSDHFGYEADRAQHYATRREAGKSQLKLGKDPRLKEWVVERLQEDWSPEQIAGRLRHHPPKELRDRQVCHETIYQFVYNSEGQWLDLWRCLRRRHQMRRPVRTRQTRPTLIPERTSIHLRPEAVNDRTILGHWESDTVEGRRGRPGGLSVQVERLSRFTLMTLLGSKRAEETADALVRTVERLPQGTVRSVTFDNGPEGAKHTVLQGEYGIPTYFTDPYCSWQKGTVENMNGFIRQYFPKRFDPTTTTDDQVRRAEDRLNHRPRKCLTYQTPAEVFATLSGALAS